jgi:hypothetical protein
MIIDQLFTRPIFEAADPNRLIATITLAKEYNADEPTKEIDLTGRFQGDVKSQMNQAADYLTQFLQSKGFNFTSIQLKYQGMVMNAQNRGAMAPQSDWEKEAEATANQMRAKRPAQNTAPALKEFAPSDDDSNGSDPEELLRRMAAYWWNGNEKQMSKVENTLAAMGWEIGQDDGYDDGGVFVVRAGDEHGGSYISWPHADLELNEGNLNEFAPGEGSGDSGNYLKALARAWYTMDFEMLAHIARQGGNPLKNRMDVQETIENMLDRGIHCGDGRVRKYYIGYNADFDGVEIQSHDHYEHSDTDDDGNDIDSRTGKPWGPYDVVEFSGDDLDESVNPGMAEGRKKKNKKTSRSLGRYFFPGFGYYGSGESGEGGGDGGGGGESVNPGMAEGEYDSRKPFGVRYKVFAGREGRLTTREYYTSSEEKLQRAVDKIQALDNFYEIDGYSYPKEQQGVAEDTTDDLLNMRQDDPRIKRNQDITALAKEIYAQMVAERGQPMDRRQQQTWMAIAQTKAAAQLSNRAAQNESQGVAEGLTEMDKSQTPPGRDTGPREGPEGIGKPITKEKMVKRALDALAKSMAKKDDKKKDVSEGMESFGDEYLRKAADPNRFGRFLISVEQAQAELDARAQGKQQAPPPAPLTPPAKSQGFSKEYLQGVVNGTHPRPLITKEKAQELLNQMNENIDPLMNKLRRAMVREGRVKELALDLKTMSDADFMKKYGKAKAAIRASMKRIDEKLTTSDPFAFPAAKASSVRAIDDPDIMGSLRSGAGISRLGKKDIEPKLDFRAGIMGDETEVKAEPQLMVDPLPDMQKWGGKFATGSAGGDNRFTAPTGWRYVEKGEDPARYGSEPAAATSALPNLIYDPQSRTLKSADAPALDMSPKSNFKFDRATQSQVPADGSGANTSINAAKQKVDWKTIYALNKATIGSNPNVIRPRMQLNMPNGTIYLVQPGDTLTKIAAKQNQVNELSTEKLAQYKTAAAADAKKADQAGDVKRGDKRFSGIVKATKKQFDNDAKQVDESRAARRALMARIVNHR